MSNKMRPSLFAPSAIDGYLLSSNATTNSWVLLTNTKSNDFTIGDNADGYKTLNFATGSNVGFRYNPTAIGLKSPMME
jgi:hypothetical protein